MSRGIACGAGKLWDKAKELSHTRGAAIVASCAAACLICWTAIYGWTSDVASDVPFFLSTGRHIVENGIPYENPFSVEPGLRIVVQQWLWDVVCWLLYSVAGGRGVSFLGTALVFCVAAQMARCLRACRGEERISCSDLFIAGIITFLGSGWIVQVRPHLLTMCAMLECVIVCEKTRRDGELRRLSSLPLLMICHMQVHMAMAWLDVFIVACYELPKRPPAHGEGFAAWAKKGARAAAPYLICCAAMALVSPINPYGVAGAMYVFNSSGAAAYRSAITEMLPFAKAVLLDGPSGWVVWAYIFIGCALAPAAVSMARRRYDLRHLAICAAALVATLMHVRSGWIVCLSGAALWADALGGAGSETDERADRQGTAGIPHPVFLSILVAGACVVAMATQPCARQKHLDTYGEDFAPLIARAKQENAAAGDAETRVLCMRWVDFNYLELMGEPVLVDARPEIWEPAVSGSDKHLNQEFFDAIGAGPDGCEVDDQTFHDYVRRHGVTDVVAFAGTSVQNPCDLDGVYSLDWLEKTGERGAWVLLHVEE